jgi:hypothetical protein
MGTRSITRFFETYEDKGKKYTQKLLTLYRQYDGYPSGMGTDIASFLNSGKVVNGIGLQEPTRVFNGAGCLAAQFIAEMKQGAGGLYVYPINAKDCGQEYEYHIYVDFDTKNVRLKCFEVGYMNKKGNYVDKNKLLFDGDPKDFEAFVEKRG